MKNLKKLLSLVLAMFMVMSLGTMQALAVDEDAEPTDIVDEMLEDDSAAIMAAQTKYVYYDHWTRIYTGTGSAVNLYVANYAMFWLKIEMIDYDGIQVWHQEHTIAPGGTGSYYVGSNVKYVNMMIDDITGSGYITVTKTSAN